MKYYILEYNKYLHIAKTLKSSRLRMIYSNFPGMEEYSKSFRKNIHWKEIPLEKYIEYKLKYGF